MTDADLLAQRFETHRAHLRAVALRMLGSGHEADDAVQEAWLRLSRSDADAVDNLGGWLTTVVARVCLDMLRSRSLVTPLAEPSPASDGGPAPALPAPALPTPEDEALLADTVGLALLVVLDTLAPAERLAFVLHDLFAVPFDEIGTIVGRSPVAARQLASRARRRVQADPAVPATAASTQREVVTAFLAASRQGDFEGLLRLLDPEAEIFADATVRAMNPDVDPTARGAGDVARMLCGRARAARLTLIDGQAGAMFALRGEPKVVFAFTVLEGRVVRIDLLGDAETLGSLELEPVRAE